MRAAKNISVRHHGFFSKRVYGTIFNITVSSRMKAVFEGNIKILFFCSFLPNSPFDFSPLSPANYQFFSFTLKFI